MTALFIIGLLLILLGLTVMILSILLDHNAKSGYHQQFDREEPRIQGNDHQVKGGAIIMIGPIPIVAGSDSRIVLILMFMGLIMMIIWILFVKV